MTARDFTGNRPGLKSRILGSAAAPDRTEHPHGNTIPVDESMVGRPNNVQCATFTFNGNLASTNPRAKAHIGLMFRVGAKIPGKHPCLEGGADTARYMQIFDEADVTAKRAELGAAVSAWCSWKE